MPSPRQRRGTEAEDRAADFLIEKGMQLIDRHVSSRYGEIDLLMRDGDTIVAVEVKARKSAAYGSAIEAVTSLKYQKIANTLYTVCEARGWVDPGIRIDVVTVDNGVIAHYRGVEVE